MPLGCSPVPVLNPSKLCHTHHHPLPSHGLSLPDPQDGCRTPLSAPRVLLAEDNRDLQQILTRQLNRLGLEVVGAMNGREAALWPSLPWRRKTHST